MKGFSNYHTHCNFCDGSGSMTDVVESALRLGLASLGFSSHAPLPFSTSWAMKIEKLSEYLQTIQSLKAQYQGKLQIHLGFEVDYIPGITGPGRMKEHKPDYLIGSLHYVDSKSLLTIDYTVEEFEKLIDHFPGGVREMVERYYELTGEMAEKEAPDIIGHMDLVRMNNTGNRFFSERDTWYRNAVDSALHKIATAGSIVEVNTAPMKRGKGFYPSPWILERCLALKIPLTMNSDSHKPEHLDCGFSEAARLIRETGHQELMVRTESGWSSRKFDQQGIIW
ncbi:MAG: histidinol-phosphatase [Candidatus Wallbacteria bacterium]|nr:histidinol-phosphatase [Candidatus Wallbacteria bacterium]